MNRLLLSLLLSSIVMMSSSAWALMCREIFPISHGPVITVIIGTDRADSMSEKMSLVIAQELESQGAQVNVLKVHDGLKMLFQNDSIGSYFNTGDSFKAAYDDVIKYSQGLVIVFPEYFGTYAGATKYFLDYVQASFVEKPVSLVGISAGQIGAYRGSEDLKSTLNHRGAVVYSPKAININFIEKKLEGLKLTDQPTLERMQQHFGGFISFITKLQTPN